MKHKQSSTFFVSPLDKCEQCSYISTRSNNNNTPTKAYEALKMIKMIRHNLEDKNSELHANLYGVIIHETGEFIFSTSRYGRVNGLNRELATERLREWEIYFSQKEFVYDAFLVKANNMNTVKKHFAP